VSQSHPRQSRSTYHSCSVTYRSRDHGAILFLPNGGYNENLPPTKEIGDYFLDHIDSWFTWSQNNEPTQRVERMEDLIFVSGCTLATSWAAAAFVDKTTEAQISLATRNSGTTFVWSDIQGAVAYHNSPVRPPGYV
jgi:hypothetical protein